MAILFLIIAFFAILHFVLESILVPSGRQSLRFDLFEIRDRLRQVKAEYGKVLDTEVYRFLEGSINNTLRHMHLINISVIIDVAKKINSNPDLKKEIQKRSEILNRCQLEEIKKIQKDYVQAFGKIVALNSMGWLIYLIPFIPIIFFYKKCKKSVKDILFIPDKELEDILPEDTINAVLTN